MKKSFVLLMTMLLVLGLVACGGPKTPETSAPTVPSTAATTAPTEPAETQSVQPKPKPSGAPLALAFVGGGATVGGIGALVYFLMKKRR